MQNVGTLVYNPKNGKCLITIDGEQVRHEQGFLSTIEKLNNEGFKVYTSALPGYEYGELCEIRKPTNIK